MGEGIFLTACLRYECKWIKNLNRYRNFNVYLVVTWMFWFFHFHMEHGCLRENCGYNEKICELNQFCTYVSKLPQTASSW